MEEHHTHSHHHEPHEHHGHTNDKEGTITVSRMTMWKTASFVLLGLLVISVFTGGFGFGGESTGNLIGDTNPTPSPPPTRDAPTGNIKVSVTDADPVLGEADAPITIVEFSDFQCPFCARAANDAVADLKNSAEFTSGKVNLVYKHFPLNSIHPQAQKAAEASECANRQGKFWEYHDLLFDNQNALDIASLKSYASDAGLNTGQFNSCLDGGEASSKVSNDLGEATAAGGRGTPYFVVINNDDGTTQAVSGAVPFSQFQSAINAVQ